MGILYITEYSGIADLPVGKSGQIPAEPAIAEQAVTFSTHAESNAFNANTRLVRITPDSICSVSFGAAPTATTGMGRMAAGSVEYRAVPFGQSYKVSAVSNT